MDITELMAFTHRISINNYNNSVGEWLAFIQILTEH